MKYSKRRFFHDAPLILESGKTLQSFELVYETYGALNDSADNAILVCHGLTANSHVAEGVGEADKKPGWWDAAVGPGKALDTEKYFVLCSNVLGSCGGSTGPSSIDKTSGKPFGLSFPVVTVPDMVDAQALLADELGVKTFHTIVGGCLGGFQTLQWMKRYPDRLRNAIIISATHRTTTHNLGLWEVIRQAIMRDPNFKGGNYYGHEFPASGMGLAQMFGIMIWMDPKVMSQRFGLKLNHQNGPSFTLEPEFEFQSFLHKIGENAARRFDPNSLIYLTKAMDYFDLTSDGKDLSECFKQGTYRCLLLSYLSDWRYPPEQMRKISSALAESGKTNEFHVLDSNFGHGAFIYDSGETLDFIRGFISSTP